MPRSHLRRSMTSYAKTDYPLPRWSRAGNCAHIAAAFLVASVQSISAYGQCTNPALQPKERANAATWTKLQDFAASSALNKKITRVQSLKTLGHGEVNNDFYSITIDALSADFGRDSAMFVRDTPETLATYIRKHLNEVIFGEGSYHVAPYDQTEDEQWRQGEIGSLMTFTLASIPNVMPIERGSVVLSCADATTWMFSTVETSKDGLHPVAGNRAFGVNDDGKGGLIIWTKAADRIVNAGIFASLPRSGREYIFNQGSAVWTGMLDRLSARFVDRNPRERVSFSVRRQYVE